MGKHTARARLRVGIIAITVSRVTGMKSSYVAATICSSYTALQKRMDIGNARSTSASTPPTSFFFAHVAILVVATCPNGNNKSTGRDVNALQLYHVVVEAKQINDLLLKKTWFFAAASRAYFLNNRVTYG